MKLREWACIERVSILLKVRKMWNIRKKNEISNLFGHPPPLFIIVDTTLPVSSKRKRIDHSVLSKIEH